MSDEMSLKEARRVTGHKAGLGKPSKMPGYSTAIPASACRTGAKLAQIPGSVCASCYAMRGNYLYTSVREGLQRRMEAIAGELPRVIFVDSAGGMALES